MLRGTRHSASTWDLRWSYMTAATASVNSAFQTVRSLRADVTKRPGANDREEAVASAVGETKLPSTLAISVNNHGSGEV